MRIKKNRIRTVMQSLLADSPVRIIAMSNATGRKYIRCDVL